MRALALAVLLSLATSAAATSAAAPGFIVSGHWKGGQLPKVEWEYDIRRHDDREAHGTDDDVLATLIPTRGGKASLPSFTAYCAGSRAYYATAMFNSSAAYLFGRTLANDVGNATGAREPVLFGFPAVGAKLVGVQPLCAGRAQTRAKTKTAAGAACTDRASCSGHGDCVNQVCACDAGWSGATCATPPAPASGDSVLAIFADGTVLQVDPSTGASAHFADLLPKDEKLATVSTAVAQDPTGFLYFITDKTPLLKKRDMIVLDPAARVVTAFELHAVKYHDPATTVPFAMVWLEDLQYLLIFYAGMYRDDGLDQILFADPTGVSDMTLMWQDLSQVQSLSPAPWPSQYQLQFQDHCKIITACVQTESDLMQQVVVDPHQQEIFFQGTFQDSTDPDFHSRMFAMPIPTKVHQCDRGGLSCVIRTAADIVPSYGWAGYQYVDVVA